MIYNRFIFLGIILRCKSNIFFFIIENFNYQQFKNFHNSNFFPKEIPCIGHIQTESCELNPLNPTLGARLFLRVLHVPHLFRAPIPCPRNLSIHWTSGWMTAYSRLGSINVFAEFQDTHKHHFTLNE